MLKLSVVWMQIRSSFTSTSCFKIFLFLFLRSWGGCVSLLPASLCQCGLTPESHTPTQLENLILFSQRLLSNSSLPAKNPHLELSVSNWVLARGHVKYVLLSHVHGKAWALKQMHGKCPCHPGTQSVLSWMCLYLCDLFYLLPLWNWKGDP